ncbi:hypothetical protein [Microbacterium sp. Leaf320]|uniref:hypothetical protein n=1 Tax=Microbacterium sp. Leaf320 TaxID=1736334 RepID=UPI000A93AD29|nr:hypothetical protein [Microbacterium sp. Leaf320]
MTATQKVAVETVWVPGLAGWQGQQGSTTGLVALGVLLAAAAGHGASSRFPQSG